MQLLIKLVITAILVISFLVLFIWGVGILSFVWSSQIDTKETLWRMLKRLISPPKVAEVIAIRDPNRIYQNGKEVGNVTGPVDIKNDVVIFHKLSETSKLDEGRPFEYKEDHLKIISVGPRIGRQMTGTTSDSGKLLTTEQHDVIENVNCKKLP